MQPQNTPEPRLALTVTEAAKAIGMSRSRFYVELSEGRIAAKKVGSRTLVPVDNLKAWLAGLPAANAEKVA